MKFENGMMLSYVDITDGTILIDDFNHDINIVLNDLCLFLCTYQYRLNNVFTRERIFNAITLYLKATKVKNYFIDSYVYCDDINNSRKIIDNGHLVVDVHLHHLTWKKGKTFIFVVKYEGIQLVMEEY